MEVLKDWLSWHRRVDNEAGWPPPARVSNKPAACRWCTIRKACGHHKNPSSKKWHPSFSGRESPNCSHFWHALRRNLTRQNEQGPTTVLGVQASNYKSRVNKLTVTSTRMILSLRHLVNSPEMNSADMRHVKAMFHPYHQDKMVILFLRDLFPLFQLRWGWYV